MCLVAICSYRLLGWEALDIKGPVWPLPLVMCLSKRGQLDGRTPSLYEKMTSHYIWSSIYHQARGEKKTICLKISFYIIIFKLNLGELTS